MKKQWIALFLCAMLLFAAGCAATPSSLDPASSNAYDSVTKGGIPETELAQVPAPEASAAPMSPDTDEGAGSSGWGSNTGETTTVNEETTGGGYKIIRSADISIETRTFDEHLAHIRQRVEELNGYVSNSSTYGRKPENYGDSGRNANISVRIPQQHMEAFLADTRGLATVIGESTYGEDITASYFDTESRLSIYTMQRDRILGLLEKAETMEDIIALEAEHARLTYEIEALTTQIRRWDDLVSFATVTIQVYEIPPATMTVTHDDSMGTRIREGFARTISGVSVFFEELLVLLLVGSPVLVLIAIVVVIIVLIRRRRRKKAIANGEAPQYKRAKRKERDQNAPNYDAPKVNPPKDNEKV